MKLRRTRTGRKGKRRGRLFLRARARMIPRALAGRPLPPVHRALSKCVAASDGVFLDVSQQTLDTGSISLGLKLCPVHVHFPRPQECELRSCYSERCCRACSGRRARRCPIRQRGTECRQLQEPLEQPRAQRAPQRSKHRHESRLRRQVAGTRSLQRLQHCHRTATAEQE